MAKENHSVSERWTRIRNRLIGRGKGRGPDELDVGPRGRRGTREYEARRPGDVPDGSAPDEGGEGGWDGLLRRIRRREVDGRSGSDTQV